MRCCFSPRCLLETTRKYMVFHLVNQIRMTNVSFTYIISFDSDHSIEIYSIRVITKLPNSEQIKGESWSWSYGSWIYKYLCNQCLSPLKLWVRTPFMARWTRYTLCDKVCQWLAAGRWFTPISSTNKTDRRDITEILLKVALNTINLNQPTSIEILIFVC
jgi:hypothetical protein